MGSISASAAGTGLPAPCAAAEAVGYVGPDRRRFNSGDYTGPLKRRSDPRDTPESARIIQALKILKAAIVAVESDPAQALRSIQAQAAELQKFAVAVSDLKLTTAAADFQRWLTAASAKGPLTLAETSVAAAPLVAMLPKEEPRDQAAA